MTSGDPPIADCEVLYLDGWCFSLTDGALADAMANEEVQKRVTAAVVATQQQHTYTQQHTLPPITKVREQPEVPFLTCCLVRCSSLSRALVAP